MYLQDELQSGKDAMPDSSFCYVARTLFDFVGEEIMALLGEEVISAFNMFAIFRLHRDVTTLANFAETCYPPGLVVRLETPVYPAQCQACECCAVKSSVALFCDCIFCSWTLHALL